MALSSAAIVSVYGVGYARTDAAASREMSPVVAAAITPATSAATLAAPSISFATYPVIVPSATVPSATIPSATVAPATIAPVTQPTRALPSLAPMATATVAAPSTAAPIATAANAAPTRQTNTATPLPATAVTAPPVAAAPATGGVAVAHYKDGTYVGTGTSRHGSITATVVIRGGAIASAAITQCGTRYPCSKIAALPDEVVTRQSDAVDAVSGATDSSVAYQGAVANALAKAIAG